MRFMMIMHPAPQTTAEDYMPNAEDVGAMTRYNEELTRAGAMLSGDGLHPPEKGARVRFSGGKPSVTDGPFSESKEVIGGFWLIDVRSRDEAVEWASRCPAADGDMIEVRQVFEMSDFPADVQEAAKF